MLQLLNHCSEHLVALLAHSSYMYMGDIMTSVLLPLAWLLYLSFDKTLVFVVRTFWPLWNLQWLLVRYWIRFYKLTENWHSTNHNFSIFFHCPLLYQSSSCYQTCSHLLHCFSILVETICLLFHLLHVYQFILQITNIQVWNCWQKFNGKFLSFSIICNTPTQSTLRNAQFLTFHFCKISLILHSYSFGSGC